MGYQVRGGLTVREYNRIHKWAERKMTKIGQCFYCEIKGKTVWSNIDHKYRQDVTEWQEVCHKCHVAYDTVQLGMKTGKLSPRYISRENLELLARLKTYSWYQA